MQAFISAQSKEQLLQLSRQVRNLLVLTGGCRMQQAPGLVCNSPVALAHATRHSFAWPA